MFDLVSIVASVLGIASALGGLGYWVWQNRPAQAGHPILIFVSMGGTCRDPTAKAILEELLKGRKPKIAIRAAGILRGQTTGASLAARRVVEERLGIDALKWHRSTMLKPAMIGRAKLILTMSADNKKQILKAHPDASGKIYTLKEFLGKRGEVKNPYVPDDPLSGAAMIRYRACYDELHSLLSEGGNIEKIYNAVRA